MEEKPTPLEGEEEEAQKLKGLFSLQPMYFVGQNLIRNRKPIPLPPSHRFAMAASIAVVGSISAPRLPPRPRPRAGPSSPSAHVRSEMDRLSCSRPSLAPSSLSLVPRRNVMTCMLSSLLFSQLRSHEDDTAEASIGFREHIDTFDGYTFLYPQGWIQVRGAGADIFFRDPIVLDENLSVELSSPSSSRYKSVEDLGSPQAAAEKVLRQYLTEFMSTRLGVRRESNILSASSRIADDGKVYYQVEVNIKSYASNNELAVMPQDRVQELEWDRRYLSVLGVENNRLYELRLQSPENVFLEEEKDLREVMGSFRVVKSVN